MERGRNNNEAAKLSKHYECNINDRNIISSFVTGQRGNEMDLSEREGGIQFDNSGTQRQVGNSVIMEVENHLRNKLVSLKENYAWEEETEKKCFVIIFYSKTDCNYHYNVAN